MLDLGRCTLCIGDGFITEGATLTSVDHRDDQARSYQENRERVARWIQEVLGISTEAPRPGK